MVTAPLSQGTTAIRLRSRRMDQPALVVEQVTLSLDAARDRGASLHDPAGRHLGRGRLEGRQLVEAREAGDHRDVRRSHEGRAPQHLGQFGDRAARSDGVVDRGLQRWGITAFPYDAAVWSSGGEVLSEDATRWVMTTPVATGAFQWCADLALREGVAPNPSRFSDGALGSELFEAGIVAMHIDGRWMVPRYRKLAFDWDVAPIPVPVRGQPAITRSGSVGLAVSARSLHPKEAFTVAEYLAGPRGQAKLTKSGFQLPNQRALASTNVFLQRGQRPAHAEAFVMMAETSRPGAMTKTPNAFWHDVFDAYAVEVWRGERTAADLFPELAPRIDQTLEAAFEEASLTPGSEAAREQE